MNKLTTHVEQWRHVYIIKWERCQQKYIDVDWSICGLIEEISNDESLFNYLYSGFLFMNTVCDRKFPDAFYYKVVSIKSDNKFVLKSFKLLIYST